MNEQYKIIELITDVAYMVKCEYSINNFFLNYLRDCNPGFLLINLFRAHHLTINSIKRELRGYCDYE